jgi:2'-5' RNA ligase
MNRTLRLFVAIELPEAVKDELGKLIDALNALNTGGVRCVRSEGVHLTLKFLGNVDSRRVDTLSEALKQAVAGRTAFRLQLGQAGAFPNLHRPRVLWVGIDGDMTTLSTLQADVEDELADVGFSKEERGYNPHLTLARIRRGSQPSSVERATGILTSNPINRHLEIPVTQINLMRTELHPDGAIHRCMVSIPLLHG